jgi:hypothetical protein
MRARMDAHSGPCGVPRWDEARAPLKTPRARPTAREKRCARRITKPKKRELPTEFFFLGSPLSLSLRPPNGTTHLERDGLARQGLHENLHGGRPVVLKGGAFGRESSFSSTLSLHRDKPLSSPLLSSPSPSLARAHARRGRGRGGVACGGAARAGRKRGERERGGAGKERARDIHRKICKRRSLDSPSEVFLWFCSK